MVVMYLNSDCDPKEATVFVLPVQPTRSIQVDNPKSIHLLHGYQN